MKRRKCHFFVAAMSLTALFVMTACQRESSNVFTLSTEGYGGAKDYMADNYRVCWNDGDMLRINDGVYGVSVDGSNNNKATVNASGVTGFAGSYYAVYPAEGSSVGDDGTITVILPEEETYTTNGDIQVLHNVMAGHTSGSSMKMKNLCSLLRLPVSSGVSGMKLCAIEVLSSKAMCGTITATPSGEEEWDVVCPAVDHNTKRILRFDPPVTLSASAQYFYMLVPAVADAENFTLRYYVEDNSGNVNAYQRTKSAAFTFAAGMVYGFDAVAFSGSVPTGYTNVTLGTESAPYKIFSSQSWTTVIGGLSGTTKKYIELESDVSVSSTIETLYSSIDGNGHTVTLSGTSSLIKTMETSSVVSNLTVEAPAVVTSVTTASNAFGFIACFAKASSEISNCVNKCSLDCSTGVTNIGAICGDARGVVAECRNEGVIRAKSNNLGGIVGNFGGTEIRGCVNTATVTQVANTSTIYCGGVTGSFSNRNASVSDCENRGTVTIETSGSSATYIGGVFGMITASLSGCTNIGKIVCTTPSNYDVYAGGVVGLHNTASPSYEGKTMSDCYNEGDIEFSALQTKNCAGGLVSKMFKLTVKNSYALCDISKAYNSAGVVAVCNPYENLTIRNCYYWGNMNTSTSRRFVANNLSSSYVVTANYCYYKSGLSSLTGCTESDCGELTSKTTISGISGSVSLVTALNGQNEDLRRWAEREGRVTFE